MHQDKFYFLLNKVFSLMMENRLREDIDDTLLEKLLSIFKTDFQNECFINDLLKNTQVLIFCEKALSALLRNEKELSIPVTVFALRLIGLIYENQNAFIAQKNSSVTLALSNIAHCNIFVSHSPSVQDALLTSLMLVGKHPEGALWLIEQKFIDFVFASFSSTSYYVKKTAGRFFSNSLILWTNSELFATLLQSHRNVLEDVISKLISGIEPPKDTQSENVVNCCILALKQTFENNVELLNDNFPLLDEIIEYLAHSDKNDKINQDAIDLLLTILPRNHTDTLLMKSFIRQLADHRKFPAAFHLASSFLSFSDYKPLSLREISLLLIPLDVLSGTEQLKKEEDIFSLISTLYPSVMQEMEVKSNGVLLINSSLRALTKLTCFLNTEAIATILSTLKFAVQPLPEAKHFLSHSCLENRTICLSLLELFASFLRNKIYASMDFHCQQILCEYLIQFLRRPSADNNIVSEALQLLKTAIALNAEYKITLDQEMANELVKILCRKLFDNREPIVDSALHLAGEIINGKDHDVWRPSVLKESVHMMMWDIAVEGWHDGVIKASALKVVTEACLQSCYLNDIKLEKSISEVDIMKILCNYVQDPDFFIQREAISCACKWMNAKERLLPSSCKGNLFSILSSAVRSLDLDLKLAALDQWKWCIENDALFPPMSKCNVSRCLASYCTSGFSGSLMYAIEDYDEAVKYKAANIIRDLREKLIHLGLDKEFVVSSDTETETVVKADVVCDASVLSVTKEEQSEGIDSVMKLSTTQQLLNICKISDFPESYSYGNCSFPTLDVETCSIASFWKCLWSLKLNTILCDDHEVPTTVFSDYSLSLLEDIIAAEKTDVVHSMNDTPDCY